MKALTDNIDVICEMYPDEVFKTMPEYDEAILGVETHSMSLIYSEAKIVEILARDMSDEDAIEYFEFNVAGSLSSDPNHPII